MQLEFEFVFDTVRYDGMKRLKLSPESDGYVRPKVWRSTDLGQTYRVAIVEDITLEHTVVTITKPNGGPVTIDEGTKVLDAFYPTRTGTRLESSDLAETMKYAVIPGDEDLKLPWYKQQLIPSISTVSVDD